MKVLRFHSKMSKTEKLPKFEHLWDRQGNGNVLEKAEVDKIAYVIKSCHTMLHLDVVLW